MTKTWKVGNAQRAKQCVSCIAIRNFSVMRRLEVLVIAPSIEKYAVGPLVRLGISPILYALVGRPKVLAATCARMHSSGDALHLPIFT